MSLAEIKSAVDSLSPEELAELAVFIRERDNAIWDRQIDADFAEGGRLCEMADEVRADMWTGKLQDLPGPAGRRQFPIRALTPLALRPTLSG
jgi:hypothetical protein